MSADDIQTVINIFGIVSVVISVWLLIKVFKDGNDMEIKDNDWVIDFCAGKPYKKGLK